MKYLNEIINVLGMKTIIIIKYSVFSTFAFLPNSIYEGGFGKK